MSKQYIPLHQANLRRWLDKRVPLSAPNVTLSNADHSTLCHMVKKWRIPVLIREEAKDNYSIIIDEGTGVIDEMYVAAVNVKGDDLVGAMYDMGIRFDQWRCVK